MKKIISFLMLLSFFIITPIYADEINDFHIEADNNIKLKDTINGDSAIAGNIIDIIGNINGIGFLAGQNININGNLEYGFLAGQNININGNITKNIYSAGETIKFSKEANIGKDIFIIGDTIILNGSLQRNIRIYATNITIKKDTIINGNITLQTSNLNIEDGAKIKGTLKYNKDANSKINDNNNIGKIVTYEVKKDNKPNTKHELANILNMIVVFLVITLLIPQVIDKTNKIYEKNKKLYIKNIGIGFLILITTPIISLFLLASNIGVYLGLILITLYIISLYLSFIISGYLIGHIITKKLMKLETNKFLTGIIGIILLKIFILIPIINSIIILIAITIGLATIGNLLQKEKVKKENKIIKTKLTEKNK